MNLVQCIDTDGKDHVTLFKQYHDMFDSLGVL